MQVGISALLPFAALAACAAPSAPPPPEPVTSARPLDTLPAEAGIPRVRADLLATAGERYGSAALSRALAAPTHLIVKRFAGMAPPPPPGAGPDWRPPTPSAMLIKEGGQWLAATPDGWRPVAGKEAGQLDSIIAAARFWSEPAYTQACPDFGASNLLLKVPGRAETVRNAQCTSAAADLVQAALSA